MFHYQIWPETLFNIHLPGINLRVEIAVFARFLCCIFICKYIDLLILICFCICLWNFDFRFWIEQMSHKYQAKNITFETIYQSECFPVFKTRNKSTRQPNVGKICWYSVLTEKSRFQQKNAFDTLLRAELAQKLFSQQTSPVFQSGKTR